MGSGSTKTAKLATGSEKATGNGKVSSPKTSSTTESLPAKSDARQQYLDKLSEGKSDTFKVLVSTVLAEVYDSVIVLKTKCDSEAAFLGDFEVTKAANLIADTYVHHRGNVTRREIRAMLMDLGFPDFCERVSKILMNKYPEYSTWDRENWNKQSDDGYNNEDGVDKTNKTNENGEAVKENTVVNVGENVDKCTVEKDKLNATVDKDKSVENGDKNVPSQNNDPKTNNAENNEVTPAKATCAATDEKDKDTACETTADSKHITQAQDFMISIVKTTTNYSDVNNEFCIKCAEAGLVKVLIDVVAKSADCTAMMRAHMNPETGLLKKYTKRGRLLSSVLSTLHNLSKRVPCRQYFTGCDGVPVLLPLLKDDVTLFSAKSLLILAYLTDEKNNHLIMASPEPIKFLIFLVSKACRMVRRRYLGFANTELAQGLAQIAVNDANKKLIGQNAGIPLLVNMIAKAKGDAERIAAAEALWILAFDNENKEAIQNNPQALEELNKLKSSENGEVRKAAAGALWEVTGKQSHTVEVQGTPTSNEVNKNHIMISYQWDIQPLIIQVKDKLKAAGYNVWMDLEQMGGSTLEAMANAVENAAVVLVCVSQKYKESPNCRSEAEYAFQLHKNIIPLMMESRYRPDGWLGMIVGAKLWIDFTNKRMIDSSMEKLEKEIGTRGKDGGAVAPIEVVKNADVVDAVPKLDISNWTTDECTKWMKQIGISPSNNSVLSEYLNGRLLLRLAELRRESPEFFYSRVERDLGLSNLYEVVLFTDELDKLV